MPTQRSQTRDGTTSGIGSDPVNLAADTDFSAGGTVSVWPCGLYVEVGGNVKMDFADGSTDTWAVPNNAWIHMIVKKVYSAVNGTTATGIHAVY